MSARVAPSMPPREAPISGQKQYSTIIDVVLDHVCCAAEEGGGGGGRRGSAPPSLARQSRQQPSRDRQPNKQQQRPPPTLLASVPSRLTSSSGPESIILPHLRFNPLPPAPSDPAPSHPPSSLDDFFSLFLADDAPHPFQSFHERSGDEYATATSWRRVGDGDSDYGRVLGEVDRSEDDAGPPGDEFATMERTVAFRTKISPGSSSNPLSQSEHANSNTSSSTLIPLGVTITQTLHRRDPGRWTLRCEFSFNFSSYGGGKLGAGGGLGAGLSQLLMSSAIRGSAVCVAVMLSECDEAYFEAGQVPPAKAERGARVRQGAGSGGGGSVATARHVTTTGCALPPCQEDGRGLLSCLSHPLLMPPDGLCSARPGGRGPAPPLVSRVEPSRVGASLLSAISSKNQPPSESEFGGSDVGVLARSPSPEMPGRSRFEDLMGRDAAKSRYRARRGDARRRDGEQHADILSRSSSQGSLKAKRIQSFEVSRSSRAPSAEAMRRMILEKNGATPDGDGGSPSCVPQLSSSSSSVTPQGLSMRIEMELSPPSSRDARSSAPSATSSLTSFSRSASFSTIDDKVRRGLKKRVARSWIAWAEGWCMRLWEEKVLEIQATGRRVGALRLGSSGPLGGRRGRSNVRPSVRRLGESPKPLTTPSLGGVWRLLVSDEGCGGEGNEREGGRGERWMPLEREGEVLGVEVTVPTSQSAMSTVGRGLSPAPSSDGGGASEASSAQSPDKASKKSRRRGLLKGLGGGP